MNTELAELRRHLSAEQQRIEYWRDSPNLKSRAEIQAELQPKSFTPNERPPLAPNKESASRMLWEQLHQEYRRREPHNTALNLTSGIASAFVLLITVALASQFHSLIAGILLGVLAATVVAVVGFGVTSHARRRDITEKVQNVFDDRFSVRWNELVQKHAGLIADYNEVQQQRQATWNESEQRRIATFNAVNRDPESIKSKISTLLGKNRHLSLGTQVLLSVQHLAVDLRISTLKEVIESKTRTLSEKTGKVISKSKSRDEKEFEYEKFAAGTCLSAIVQILNAAPFCDKLSIALYSGDESKRAYHVCGQIDRVNLPHFTWASVDPVALLSGAGFRIEGGKAKKLTSMPEWLKRLEQVRIDIRQTG
jgi:hypothetical protein